MRTKISTSKIVDGYHKAFIDSSIEADTAYSPQFISNSNGKKVLTIIENELKSCDDLFISVAFITMGGIAPLLGTLKDLENRGTKGRILTTDYLMFSDPKALDKLSSLNNLEIKVFKTAENNTGFHTKGYMFHNNGDLRIIVGSSNLTQSALSTNHEWNTRIVSTTNGQYAQDIESEFNDLWESSVCYEDYKDEYTELFNKTKSERTELQKITRTLDLGYSKVLVPNKMQEEFTCNIEHIIQSGEKRAILISATGTGKTYASAFALRKLFSENIYQNKRALFISHREQINKQALKSYQRIFGKNIPMSLLSGNYNDLDKAKDASFLFSTMNMMAKEEIHSKFDPNYYSVIILDECHRSGAESYKKIIDYFKPEFLLGMSASPERTDKFDVFQLFDHNIAYEIRLQQALENDLLCPFHYFGITDIEIDGEISDISKFNQLTSDARVRHILDRAEYYGHSGDRVKGLIFCSSKDEARELSRKFNDTGKYSTIMLCGEDSQEAREEAIERLVNDNHTERLDYILTVDIFNEGVDIPEINQVIMLRPTESPIVFVQQLGRGLRKSEGKEFVVVIDFIGNYQNNYMIPIALSGDRTGNKDNIRRGLMEGSSLIQGASTIYFDEVSRRHIYKSIDAAKTDSTKTLKDAYKNLRYKLGRIPTLKDFDEHGEIDPLLFINKYKSYHKFLQIVKEEEYTTTYKKEEEDILNFISTRFAAGKKVHEIMLLNTLITGGSYKDWKTNIGCIRKLTTAEESCVIKQLTGEFFVSSPSIIDPTVHCLSHSFQESIKNDNFRNAILEVIDFGISRNRCGYDGYENDSFLCINKKYTYSEVCQSLNYDKDLTSVMMGYWYDSKTNSFSVFINYEKSDDTPNSINYHDRFGSFDNPDDKNYFIAISKRDRTKQSRDMINISNYKRNGTTIRLFVRKNKNDITSKEFYYLGQVEHTGNMKEGVIAGTNIPIVEIEYKFIKPVDDRIYEYITEKSL